MIMSNIIKVLIDASEKAACVARSCSVDDNSSPLLIAEKLDDEANSRFARDFKTIADVMAQESAKNYITSAYPELEKYVRGEECAEINGVPIKIQNNVEKTTELLSKILDVKTAGKIAEAAHFVPDTKNIDLPPDLPSVCVSDLGVWIDPIDATAEFIAGVKKEADGEHGFSCVTVLIGAYMRSTGEPVFGVINQPFFKNGLGRIVWGINYEGVHVWGSSEKSQMTKSNVMLLSAAESSEIKEKIKTLGFEIESVPGAGHKLLKVILGEAVAYVVSKGTTFLWDTCGPHAILKAKGGDLVKFKQFCPVKYNSESTKTQEYCNKDGIIAYSNPVILEKIKNLNL